MFKLAKPFFLIAESPLHAGSGSDLGVVDQPIQRERHTDFPKIEGSSLKGAIREVFEERPFTITDPCAVKLLSGKECLKLDSDRLNLCNGQAGFKQAIDIAFGPDDSGDRAAALGITDARLLLFPVKSMKGVFAWITCPKIMEKLKSDLEMCSITDNFFDRNTIPQENTISDPDFLSNSSRVILEEYTFNVSHSDITKKFATELAAKTGRGDIPKRLVVLPDDDFRDFVNLSTEVITRNKINNETGTVENGALFTEEYLPMETIMYSLCLASSAHQKDGVKADIFEKDAGDAYLFGQNSQEEAILEFFCKFLPKVMQIGGNATIGKGIVSAKI